MKRRTSERGDGMTVLFVTLVVLLMAALGVIFYQNFLAKNPTTDTHSPQTEQNMPSDKKETERVAYGNQIYALDYPTGWSVAVSTKGMSKISVTSPDRDIRIDLKIGPDGFGGDCMPDQNGKVRFYNVHQEANTMISANKAYVVEAISDVKEGGYIYKIGLALEGGATHAAVGDSFCTVQSVGLVSTEPVIMADLTFLDLEKPETHTVKSMDDIKSRIERPVYKDALKILESIRKE